jgi:hypothetical protein
MKIGLLLIVSLAMPALAQDVVLEDGTPNPDFPNLFGWYQPDVGLNGSSGIPNDGTPIASWDSSGSIPRSLSRASEDPARQPVLIHDGINGKPALLFDGDDFIWGAQAADDWGTIESARTLLIVARPDIIDTGYLFDSSSINGRNAVFLGWSQDPKNWTAYTGTEVFACGAMVEFEPVVLTATFDPNSGSTVHINGQLLGSDTSEVSALAGFILGSRYNLQNQLNGAIAEVLVYDTSLDDTQRSAIESYLDSKYFGGGGGGDCPGDFNADGEVNGADFGILLASWGPCPECVTDINGDGVINGADVGLMLAYWGSCPADPCDGVDCDDSDPCTLDSCLNGKCFHDPIDGCFPGCGDPDSGSCNEDNGTPGCDDAACCSYVCNLDVFCCDVTWDLSCATLAKDCP